MTMGVNTPTLSPLSTDARGLWPLLEWLARRAEPVAISLGAILAGLALFSLFILVVGKSPADLFRPTGPRNCLSVNLSLARSAFTARGSSLTPL